MTAKDQEAQFEAYQLIKHLNDVVAETMKQVAYGQLDMVAWNDVTAEHRQAFEQWMRFVEDRALGNLMGGK
ncbi:hypothetical protein [Pseudomonas fulva]|nr:hypothetical protein [Pseudomonas fulva]MBF8780561.1 hypothetical protein [Pseudomonas fulva]